MLLLGGAEEDGPEERLPGSTPAALVHSGPSRGNLFIGVRSSSTDVSAPNDKRWKSEREHALVHVHAPPDPPVSCWGSHRSDGNAGSWSGMINGSQHILVDYRL